MAAIIVSSLFVDFAMSDVSLHKLTQINKQTSEYIKIQRIKTRKSLISFVVSIQFSSSSSVGHNNYV